MKRLRDDYLNDFGFEVDEFDDDIDEDKDEFEDDFFDY